MQLAINSTTRVALFAGVIAAADAGALIANGATIPAHLAADLTVIECPPEFILPPGWTGGEWVLVDGPGVELELAADAVAAHQARQVQAAQAAYDAAVRTFDGIVQGRIDDVARAFGYGDPNRPEVSPILHAVSYADEPAVPRFQQEGQALRAWRSNTWAYCGQVLTAVAQSQRPAPTPAELLAELETEVPAPVQAPL